MVWAAANLACWRQADSSNKCCPRACGGLPGQQPPRHRLPESRRAARARQTTLLLAALPVHLQAFPVLVLVHLPLALAPDAVCVQRHGRRHAWRSGWCRLAARLKHGPYGCVRLPALLPARRAPGRAPGCVQQCVAPLRRCQLPCTAEGGCWPHSRWLCSARGAGRACPGRCRLPALPVRGWAPRGAAAARSRECLSTLRQDCAGQAAQAAACADGPDQLSLHAGGQASAHALAEPGAAMAVRPQAAQKSRRSSLCSPAQAALQAVLQQGRSAPSPD